MKYFDKQSIGPSIIIVSATSDAHAEDPEPMATIAIPIGGENNLQPLLLLSST